MSDALQDARDEMEGVDEGDYSTDVAMVDQFLAPRGGRFQDERYGRVSSGTSTPSVSYVNESGLPDSIIDDLRDNRDIADAIERWSQSLSKQSDAPSYDMFARNSKWSGDSHIFALFGKCVWAVESDDILSTLAEVVEGLTFPKMNFEMNDRDQRDMWNQWATEVDLDSRVREQFRELFKVSQFYVGLQWERRIYSVRDSTVRSVLDEVKQESPGQAGGPNSGPGKGNRRRKKKFAVEIPTALTIFDPTKVLPVGQMLFGKERFAYIATREEHEAFLNIARGGAADPVVQSMIERQYAPTSADLKVCGTLGVDANQLWLFREDSIYRHSLTRAQYERWAVPRMKSTLPILEMKAHLRASDRASLVGSTNFIVVITKGSDKLPAKSAEIENLKEQARVVARLPVLVGDHRLHVEIVSPPTDNTLIESRWQVLDSRLVFKALQSFQPIVQGGNASGGVKETGQVVAQGLMSRRHQLMRSLERAVFRKVLERNEGVLDEMPSLTFTPKRITLDFSADIMNAILKLRDRGDVSRETVLNELDYDQDTELVRRARERADYDDVFQSSTPHSSPVANPYGSQVNPATGAPPEGGRPPGATDDEPRAKRGSKN